uniref:Uncharacterized protein n=1 Tax=Peronospora matthiolae TaxID=2874970 RepID=A0AAV1TUU8_9STRA
MRATTFGKDGQIQSMCFPQDHPDPALKRQPKELKIVLQELGLWRNGLRLKCKDECEDSRICCACSIKANKLGFVGQAGMLKELIVEKGYKTILYPQLYIELNYYEKCGVRQSGVSGRIATTRGVVYKKR